MKFYNFIPELTRRYMGKFRITEPKKQKVIADDVLRQACLIIAICLMITVMVATTLSELGVLKTKYVWDRLTADIYEERSGLDIKKLYANVMKLCKSADVETIYFAGCLIVSAIGIQYCLAFVVLIYGLIMVMKIPIYIWMFVSTLNLFYLATGLYMMYQFPGIPKYAEDVALWFEVFMAFTVVYTIIILFYVRSLSNEKSPTAVIIKAYGGYNHTVKPSSALPEKQKSNNYVV